MLIARYLYKIASYLEVYSRSLLAKDSISIHSSSKAALSKIALKSNCTVLIDEQSQVNGSIIFDKENASVSIGKRVFMNGIIVAAEKVEIGDDVLISWGVTITDHNSHSISFSQRSADVVNWMNGNKDWKFVKIAPVKIGSKVWIGFNSIILKGVTISEGAVIGAGSVVTKDVSPWTIVAGNPARLIREIPEDER